MEPKTGRPAGNKLAAIDPLDLAVECCQIVVDQLAMAALKLAPVLPPIPWPDPAALAHSDLGMTVQDLVAYAKTGKGDPLDLPDQLQDLAAAGLDVEPDDKDPGEGLGLVILAAQGRAALSEGDGATRGQLAALAGISYDGVRKLSAAGELDEEKVKDQRRWLKSRGVVGV